MAQPGGQRDPEYLSRVFDSERITTVHFVPSMLRECVRASGFRRGSSLKRVICSGEALTKELQDDFADCCDATLYNLYGPTEAAIDVTAWTCDSKRPERPIPIGRPVANTRIYVLDDDLEPVPAGAIGEICIAGINLARGYLRAASLTAQSFVPDPIGPPGARMYRSGDLGRYRTDGTFEYVGRIDDQVKLRGMRVEPGEIAAAITRSGFAHEAAVVACEHARGEARLVAYLVPRGDPSVPEIRDAVSRALPAHMVPAAFVLLDAFPLTAHGKLDKKRLPPPDSLDAALSSGYLAPRDQVEEELAAVWRQMLNVERVGVNDNFFELGGHSLLVTELDRQYREPLRNRASDG